MATRKRQFAQMELPFDKADFRQPIRPALPPGLRELQQADALGDDEVRQLQEVAYTARGKKPVTLDEWRAFAAIVQRVLGELKATNEE